MKALGEYSNRSNTGYHYYIDPEGNVIQWADDNVVMNHAGKGRRRPGDKAPHLGNANTLSIGLMTTRGGTPTEKQIAVARQLAAQKAGEHGFTAKDVYGHGEVAVGHRQATEGMMVVEPIRQHGLGQTANGVGTSANAQTSSSLGLVPADDDSDANSYAGPYRNLTPEQRNTLRRQVARAHKKLLKDMESEIKAIEGNAVDGYALPEESLNDLSRRVDESGSPKLKAKLASVISTAKTISEMRKQPLAANEQAISRISRS
jgi:hypothetical protein